MTYFEALQELEKNPDNEEANRIIKRDKKLVIRLLAEVFQGRDQNKNWRERR
jgi:hypothetical protein